MDSWRGRSEGKRRCQAEAAVMHVGCRLGQTILLVSRLCRDWPARGRSRLTRGHRGRRASKGRPLVGIGRVRATPLSSYMMIDGRAYRARGSVRSRCGRGVGGCRRAVECALHGLDMLLARLVVEVLDAPFYTKKSLKVSLPVCRSPVAQAGCLTRDEVLLELFGELHDVTAGCFEGRRSMGSLAAMKTVDSSEQPSVPTLERPPAGGMGLGGVAKGASAGPGQTIGRGGSARGAVAASVWGRRWKQKTERCLLLAALGGHADRSGCRGAGWSKSRPRFITSRDDFFPCAGGVADPDGQSWSR